jgi:hypothetical protein
VENEVVRLYTNNPENFNYGQHDSFEDETYFVCDIIENESYSKEELPFTHVVLFVKSL